MSYRPLIQNTRQFQRTVILQCWRISGSERMHFDRASGSAMLVLNSQETKKGVLAQHGVRRIYSIASLQGAPLRKPRQQRNVAKQRFNQARLPAAVEGQKSSLRFNEQNNSCACELRFPGTFLCRPLQNKNVKRPNSVLSGEREL